MTKAQVISSYFELLGAGRIDDALALLDDEGSWWFAQERATRPMSELKTLVTRAFAVMPMTFSVTNTIEQGDQVAIEVESDAAIPTGGRYRNVYCFVATIEGGLIRHVREYPDTKYGAETMPPDVYRSFH